MATGLPQTPSRSHRIGPGVAVVLVMLAAAPAVAQSRLALQTQGGGTLPLSAFVHGGVRTTGLTDDFEDEFLPRLVDQYPGVGFHVGVSFLYENIEIRYVFNRMTWDREVTVCTGANSARERASDLSIDDVLVTYDCASSTESDLSAEGRDPLLVHIFSLGYRVYLPRPWDRVSPYLVGSAGPALVRQAETHLDNRGASGNVVKGYLGAGVGADIGLGDLFSLGLEARYNVLLSGAESSSQSAANRTLQRDQTAAEAVLDAFQNLTFGLGLQVNFR